MARQWPTRYVDIESRTASKKWHEQGDSWLQWGFTVSPFCFCDSPFRLVHQATTKFPCQVRHLDQCPAASNKCFGTLAGDFSDLFGRSARLSCQLPNTPLKVTLRSFVLTYSWAYRFSALSLFSAPKSDRNYMPSQYLPYIWKNFIQNQSIGQPSALGITSWQGLSEAINSASFRHWEGHPCSTTSDLVAKPTSSEIPDHPNWGAATELRVDWSDGCFCRCNQRYFDIFCHWRLCYLCRGTRNIGLLYGTSQPHVLPHMNRKSPAKQRKDGGFRPTTRPINAAMPLCMWDSGIC